MSSPESSPSRGTHLLPHFDEDERHPPTTSTCYSGNTDTNPTVSATGMPRIIPRHVDERSSQACQQKEAEQGSPPPELGRQSSRRSSFDLDDDDDEEDDPDRDDADGRPAHQPSGSLTLAALSPSSSIPFPRRLALITSSLLINLGLPFINGVMLGFGEIFARVVVAPALGITGVGWNGNTDRARVSNPFSRRQTSALDASTARAKEPRQAKWGTWGQGSSGTISDWDEDQRERVEERGEQNYL
ncbi:hypothetical protein ACQY0O_006188 [Thecaphora frezii]